MGSYVIPAIFAVVIAIPLVAGCESNQSSQPVAESLTAIDQMRSAAESGDWERASSLIRTVLIESPDDSDALQLVAETAYRTGNESLAADLLVSLCRAEEFADAGRVNQAFTGLLAAGRLFDGIDLLQETVRVRHDNVTVRKMLHSFLVGTEQYADARLLARELVRRREFDVELLQSFGDRDRRIREADSLVEMTERNPSDLRPLIGVARFRLDRVNYAESIEILERILETNPKFITAQMMLGRALVFSGQYAQLTDWTKRLGSDAQQSAEYWLTLGDWALWRHHQQWALEAYLEAAQRDHDSVEVWNKLVSVLSDSFVNARQVDVIRQRASNLVQLRQYGAEFDAATEPSVEQVKQIVDTLVDLGRIWEAESWAALGLMLPHFDSSSRTRLQNIRSMVVSRMTKSTPWQNKDQLPSWPSAQPAELGPLLARLTQQPIDAASSTTAWTRDACPLEFANEASQRGVVFAGHTAQDLASPGVRLHETLGCGGAALDYDLDGWPDIYFVAAGGQPPDRDSPPNAMLRNQNGQLVDVSRHSGAADRGFGQGVAVGDVNEDGFDDLMVLNYGPNQLWMNNGDGTFSNHSQNWLPEDDGWSTSGAIADLDGDGISDAVALNYCIGFGPATEDCDAPGEMTGYRSCSPNHFPAKEDFFLRGSAHGGFTLANRLWKTDPLVKGRGLGVVIGSFQSAGNLGVMIVNDVTSNHFWTRSSPDSTQWVDKAALVGLANDGQSRTQGSMGIATSDFNADGTMDFYVTNFETEHNTLYLSQPGYTWRDATAQYKLLAPTMPMVGFGTKAIDLDNNGTEELAFTNGHVDNYVGYERRSPYGQPFQLFERTSDGSFSQVEQNSEDPYLGSDHVGRAMWILDVNRDDRPDLVITHQTEPPALLINKTQTDNHFVTLRLVATKGARTAIGTKVHLSNGPISTAKWLTSGDGFLCSDERCIRFGLGSATGAVEVTVNWPSGTNQEFAITTDTQWLLVEGQRPFELSGR